MKLKQADIQKIRNAMKKTLDAKRYEHTLGVAYTASCLAMCHEEDTQKALVAGLLHDCAKCIDNSKKLSICKKNNIETSKVEIENPFLLHAKVGGFLAVDKYGVKDPDIIQAILSHTTGRPNMSKLEKIIYIADYIEPNRKQASNLTEIRRLAFVDLDKALLQILKDTLEYLNTIGNTIDPMTKETYDYYCKEIKTIE